MKLLFTGDTFISDEINEVSLNEELMTLFNTCDYKISCCEAPYCSSDVNKFLKVGPNLRQGQYFPKFATHFTHLSLANNHSMDYGEEGLRSTCNLLDDLHIVTMGAGISYPDMYRPTIIEKDGVSVALFCWAESQYGCCKSEENRIGYAWMLNPITYSLIQEYKQKADYVVLYLHAGLEDEDIPLADWRRQYKSFIDYGVDLVIASHPHVIQGKETYKGKNIYYSLGNFFFSGEYLPEALKYRESLVIECNFTKDRIELAEHISYFDNNHISLDDTRIDRFNQISHILTNNIEYQRLHDKMVLKCWEDYYRDYYSFPIFKNKQKVVFYRRWFNSIMKGYVNRCFLPPVSLNQIYHNINIDTHRFVVSRVCQIMSQTY